MGGESKFDGGLILKSMEPVQPTFLHKVWPSIREELASIGAPDYFIPEDVYTACKTGEAALFILNAHDQRIGWVVLKVIGSDLHIWMLYSKSGYDVLDLFRKDLMKIAETAKATMLTFGTKRRGWDKVAPRHGFTVRQTVWECSRDDLMYP